MPVTDSDNQAYQAVEFRKKALSLTEEFASIEGRRPRILIGQAGIYESGSIHRICNAFADMGYDVDMAPERSPFKFLGTQSLENDSDIVLICSDYCLSETEIIDLEKNVLPYQPEMMLSLMTEDLSCRETLNDQKHNWIVFNDKTSQYEIGYRLLVSLMSGA